MKKFKRAGTILMLFIMLSMAILFHNPAYAKEKLVFGVHPFKSPTKLNKMFKPLIAYLEEQVGVEIVFRSAKDYETAMDSFINGDFEISYFGPALYVNMSEKYPDIRLAAMIVNNGKPTFKGVIVVREDSPINSLADLKGKKFAFGDRQSTLSCYMPAHMLIQAGILDTIDYKFLGSHDNVAKAVINGLFDGGGIKPAVAKEYIGKGLKIIAESEPVYEHVFVVSPNADEKIYNKIRSALLNVKDPNVYKSIKKSLTGFTEAKSGNYDNLRVVIKEVDARIKK